MINYFLFRIALKDELVPHQMMEELKNKAVNANFKDEVFPDNFFFLKPSQIC